MEIGIHIIAQGYVGTDLCPCQFLSPRVEFFYLLYDIWTLPHPRVIWYLWSDAYARTHVAEALKRDSLTAYYVMVMSWLNKVNHPMNGLIVIKYSNENEICIYMIENVMYSWQETLCVLLCNSIPWHASVRNNTPCVAHSRGDTHTLQFVF